MFRSWYSSDRSDRFAEGTALSRSKISRSGSNWRH
jgi:hypothetical protein